MRTGIGYGNILLICLLIAAVATRVWLYLGFPALIVNDSGDYVILAEDIYHRSDFSNPRLGDIRLPVYPLFLATTHFLGGFYSSSVVAVQKVLGVLSLLLGLTLGRLLRSRLLEFTLVAFLGFNPIYLLNEHLIMTESLFLFTLLAFSVIATVCLRGRLTVLRGASLGIALAACVLTRSNGLIFCAPILLGIMAQGWLRGGERTTTSSRLQVRRQAIHFAAGLSVTAALCFGPWLWRNHQVLGVTSLSNFSGRNVLAYQTAHGLYDPELPLASDFQTVYDPAQPSTIYRLINGLSEGHTPPETEAVAWSLVREQFLDKPGAHLQAAVYGLVHLAGFPPPNPIPGFARGEVHWWLANIVNDANVLYAVNTFPTWYPLTDFVYVHTGRDGWLNDAWSRAGLLYLDIIRPLLFALFSTTGILYLALRGFRSLDITAPAIMMWGTALVAVILFHALTLSDSDRYIVPFDWAALMVTVLIGQRLWATGVGRSLL